MDLWGGEYHIYIYYMYRDGTGASLFLPVAGRPLAPQFSRALGVGGRESFGGPQEEPFLGALGAFRRAKALLCCWWQEEPASPPCDPVAIKITKHPAARPERASLRFKA